MDLSTHCLVVIVCSFQSNFVGKFDVIAIFGVRLVKTGVMLNNMWHQRDNRAVMVLKP